MTYYERELYKKFPLYARFLDEKGMLQHFAEALQPEFTAFYQIMAERNYLFDPDLVPEKFLNFVAQSVGLASRGDRSLGMGIDPKWDVDRKRELFREAWSYWQTKGTESAIAKGTYFWLGWEDALDSTRFSTLQPFGKHPTSSPPLWWDYETSYDDHLDLKWGERKQLGSGDYPQIYDPGWDLFTTTQYTWEWSDPWWQDRERLAVDPVTPIDSPGSMLGPRSVWLQYSPDPGDWSKIFPDALELNPEMISTVARGAIFGWIEGGTVEPLWIEDFLLPDNTTEVIQGLEIDGLKWGELFPSTTGSYNPEPFIIEEDEVEFGIWAGHQWNEFWQYDWYYRKNGLVRIKSVAAVVQNTAIASLRSDNLGWTAHFDVMTLPTSIQIRGEKLLSFDFSQLKGSELLLSSEDLGFSADFLDSKSSTLAFNSLRLEASTSLTSTAFARAESNAQFISASPVGFNADLGVLLQEIEVQLELLGFGWSAETIIHLESSELVLTASDLEWTAFFMTQISANPLVPTASQLFSTTSTQIEANSLELRASPFSSEANMVVSIEGSGSAIAASPLGLSAYNWFIQNVVA